MNAEVHIVYDNEQSYEYFNHNATDNVEDSGPAFMVGKAIMGTMKAHRYMNTDDILLHLLLAKFTFTLSSEQRKLFCLILQLIRKKANDDERKSTHEKKRKSDELKNDNTKSDIIDELDTSRHISTRYPSNNSTIQRYYIESPNSIIQSLPQPNVTVIDSHSYLSVRQCIADYLGKGNHSNGTAFKPKDCQRLLTDSKIASVVYDRGMKRNRETCKDDLLVNLGIQ